MRVLLHVTLPHEPFNSYVRDGTAGEKVSTIVEAAQAEAVYFTEYGGVRTALVVVNVDDPSQMPAYAEPWFLTFEADVEFHPTMLPDDLAAAGLDELGSRWG